MKLIFESVYFHSDILSVIDLVLVLSVRIIRTMILIIKIKKMFWIRFFDLLQILIMTLFIVEFFKL